MYYFKFNNNTYTHSPFIPIITGFDNSVPIQGDILKDVLGMTEEQAQLAHIEGLKNEIRVKRDKLLAESDWVVARAFEQNSSVPQEWLEYRQSLRDITELVDGINEVQFPEKPE